MKVCSHCNIKKEDSCFRQRVDKRGKKPVVYLNNQCIECDRARAKIYYDKKKNDPAFKAKNIIRVRKYAESNVDKIKQRKKKPEWLRKHADWNMNSYKRMRDVIAAKMRIKRKTEEYKKFMREYRERNKDKIKEQEVVTKRRYHEKHMINLTDEYISQRLFNKIDRGFIDKHPDLIKAKRLQILIKRKTLNNGKS